MDFVFVHGRSSNDYYLLGYTFGHSTCTDFGHKTCNMSLRNVYFTGSSEVISWLSTELCYHFMPCCWIYLSLIYISNIVLSSKFHLLPCGFHTQKTRTYVKDVYINISNKMYILHTHFFKKREQSSIFLSWKWPWNLEDGACLVHTSDITSTRSVKEMINNMAMIPLWTY